MKRVAKPHAKVAPARPEWRHDVVYERAQDLKLWEENPRRNDAAAEKLAVTIDANGFVNPVIGWTQDKTIYAGSTRVKAARILGIELLPVLWIPFASKGHAVAFALADNRASEFADWDEGKLAAALASLDEIDVAELEKMTAFKQDEMEGLREGWAPIDAAKAPGEFPEVDESLRTEHRCPKCGYEWSGGQGLKEGADDAFE